MYFLNIYFCGDKKKTFTKHGNFKSFPFPSFFSSQPNCPNGFYPGLELCIKILKLIIIIIKV